jgi:hypothetical protein
VTNIRYDLPETADVNLEVFDAVGRRVAVLVEDRQVAGHHSIRFDATKLASGMYFYRIRAGGFSEVHRMVLLK